MNERLTVEEVQDLADGNKKNGMSWEILQQMADTMRENERLHGALQEIADDKYGYVKCGCPRAAKEALDRKINKEQR